MKLEPKKIIVEAFWGAMARILNLCVPIKKNHWVFASDYGNQYREGSKYMIEYMLRSHPEYHCTFVTLNNTVLEDLRERGVPCVKNFSFAGIWTVLRAECVFYTQYYSDIYFAYRRTGRRFFYLMHGMPYKRGLKASPASLQQKIRRKTTWWRRIGAAVREWLLFANTLDDVEFVSCCSEFNMKFMPYCYGDDMKFKILGMPRNDGLFDAGRMSRERWIDTDGKFVVTYMPTHRAYGHGEVSPTPFVGRPDILKWFDDNNVVLVMKNHPNMASKVDDHSDTPAIVDITKSGIDPQVVIYHTDVLVTDYSSVWMDYLLLRRPILFYYYDDFEHDDEGVFFNVHDDPVGTVCKSEDELFHAIRRAKEYYDSMRPSEEVVRKYHKYTDGNSCERHFLEITR